ncbi:hypothetical protein RP20_CCG012674 [Aedes albopictus]|nr:hypothetical protein RP20_CCG012674 [Aedes albopictus]
MTLFYKRLLTLIAAGFILVEAVEYSCTDYHKGYCVVENVTAESIPQATFPSDKLLLIQNSTFTTFGEEQFRCLPDVENLMIHHLKIEQLELNGCDRLSMLFASYNHISNVTAVEALPLRSLHLYQNLLTDVSPLKVLTELEQLYLNDNLLEVLTMDVFANMKNLKILTLHRNKLTAIDTVKSIGLPSLESLFLQHNALSYLDTSLWRMPALQKLDLSDNNLGFLFTFLEEFPSLAELELHTNQWNCAWLHKMVDRMEQRAIGHGQIDRTCDGTLFGGVCCKAEASEPDPMMLLISRTGIVDDLQDRLEGQREKVEQLEEAHRKQSFRYDEMRRKIDKLEEWCSNKEL